MKRYAEYKESGIEWIDEIPEEWKTKKFGYLFSFGRGLNITKADLLDEGVPCVSYGEIHSKYGFEVSSDVNPLRCVDEDYLLTSPSALLKRGDFVFADTSEDIEGSGNFTCLNSDIPIFAGYHCITARQRETHNYRYLSYLFDSIGFRSQIRCKVSGVKVFSVTQTILKDTVVTLPPIHEQEAIAEYLDEKTASIDSIIADKQRLIDLLKEKRQAIISEAVTKGLDKNVKMKDSGIEWIGEIPKGWNISRGKNILSLVKRPVPDNCEVITCFRDGEVTRRSNRREDGFTFADKEIGYQGICVGDLVIHGMDGFAVLLAYPIHWVKVHPYLACVQQKRKSI
jgi:type I restriction enzyme S subunit